MVEGLVNKVRFLIYYSKLRITVSMGLHPTSNPLNLKWGSRLWLQRQRTQHKQD